MRMARYLVGLVIATVCLFGVFAMSAYAAPTAATDETAPVTTCDAHAAYTGNATIHLAATDNDGGWGVAYVYYKLDTGYAHCVPVGTDASTSVAVVAPTTGSAKSATHTLTFWSQDKAGNVEARASKTFTVTVTREKWKVTLNLPKSSVKVNTKVKYSGTVRTSTGRAGSGVVTIQKRRASGGSWINWRTARLNASGNYSITVKMTNRGTWSFHARMPGDAVNRTGFSAPRKLRVY